MLTPESVFAPYTIFGGTFDPPHFGHLRAIQQVIDICDLPQVALLPAFIPALKENISCAHHRIAMTQKLCELDKRFTLDLSEVEANENSFTAKTLKSMAHKKPQQKRIFIMGLDSLLSIHKWYKWQSIFDYAHVVVMARPEQSNIIDASLLNLETTPSKRSERAFEQKLASNLYNFYTNESQFDSFVGAEMDVPTRQWLLSKLARAESDQQSINLSRFKDIINTSATGNLWLVKNQVIALSSSAIRTQWQKSTEGENTALMKKLLPASIINYIYKHKLYETS